jgi:hypothetical protein
MGHLFLVRYAHRVPKLHLPLHEKKYAHYKIRLGAHETHGT